jgi:hypothetical protein
VEPGNQYAELPVEPLLVRRLAPGDVFLQHERTGSLRCVEHSDRVPVGQRDDRRRPQPVGDQMRRKPCLPTDFVDRASAVPVELEDVARVVRGHLVDVVHQ